MLIRPKVVKVKTSLRMGPRQSAPEQKERNNIEETNLNLGLVKINEETFNFERVTRIEMRVGIIVLILVLFYYQIYD